MKQLLCSALLLLLLPIAAFAQHDYSYRYRYQPSDTIPWTHGLTAGFSIWPITKERLRLGYSWEHRHKQFWHIDLAYINAIESLWFLDDRYGVLEGAQLRAEYRFYQPTGRNTFFYFGPSLAYMYTRHQYKRVEGMECDQWGNCAFFRQMDEPVPAHTNTLALHLGWIVRATPIFHFDFFGGIGMRGTYFPDRKTDAYFGRLNVFRESEHFVMEPRIRLGVNVHFALRQRN